MRIACPHCGPRDRREFYFRGALDWLDHPGPDAPAEAVDRQLHLRDNPAGRVRELWQHECCGAWLVVDRCTVSHAVYGAVPVAEAARAGGA